MGILAASCRRSPGSALTSPRHCAAKSAWPPWSRDSALFLELEALAGLVLANAFFMLAENGLVRGIKILMATEPIIISRAESGKTLAAVLREHLALTWSAAR